ncbi:MAG: LPXTG cell wall anchor domain-containing protein [Clostridiales bacterium]|nr:LPXTG cell wall anchor domain-containing protein [Clostridiales bacterium]
MKSAKWISALLAAAVLATAAVPMASAEAVDFNINGQEEFIKTDADFTTVSFANDGAMTLTIAAKGDSVNSAHMMWTNVPEKFVDLSQTPYLCWDVSGTANFGLAIRYDENADDTTCYRMHNARGHADDGLAPEKNSINFLELIKKNDLGLVYSSDEIMMIAVAINVFGDVGDSVTFNKLYFSASPLGDGQQGGNPTQDGQDDPTQAGTDDTTQAPNNTTTAAPTTTKKANPSTGDASQMATAAIVLTVSAAVALFVVKQKKNG